MFYKFIVLVFAMLSFQSNLFSHWEPGHKKEPTKQELRQGYDNCMEKISDYLSDSDAMSICRFDSNWGQIDDAVELYLNDSDACRGYGYVQLFHGCMAAAQLIPGN